MKKPIPLNQPRTPTFGRFWWLRKYSTIAVGIVLLVCATAIGIRAVIERETPNKPVVQTSIPLLQEPMKWPSAVIDIREKLRGIESQRQAIEIVTKVLWRPADRDLCSWLQCPEWNIETAGGSGMLNVSLSGPSFLFEPLFFEHPTVQENLLGSYRIERRGEKSPIGELVLSDSGHYALTFASGWAAPPFSGFSQGKYEILYGPGFSDKTEMEHIFGVESIGTIRMHVGRNDDGQTWEEKVLTGAISEFAGTWILRFESADRNEKEVFVSRHIPTVPFTKW